MREKNSQTGWKFVNRRGNRRRRGSSKQIQKGKNFRYKDHNRINDGPLLAIDEDEFSFLNVKNKLDHACKVVQKSSFFTRLCKALKFAFSKSEHSTGLYIDIVTYGVGKFGISQNSCYQLACALLLREVLSKKKFFYNTTDISGDDDVEKNTSEIEGNVRLFYFDPLTSTEEKEFLATKDILCIDKNEEGKRKVERETLFFMPHCDKWLYNNVIWANWGSFLSKIVIIGNTFSTYLENTVRAVDRENPDNCMFTLLEKQLVQEDKVKVNDINDPIIDRGSFEADWQDRLEKAFSDTCVHSFQKVDETFLLKRPEEVDINGMRRMIRFLVWFSLLSITVVSSVQCSGNSHNVEGKCVCNVGFERGYDGKTCVLVEVPEKKRCPENASWQNTGCACDDHYEPNENGTECVRSAEKQMRNVLFTLPLELDGRPMTLEYTASDTPKEAAYTFLKANGINDASVLENSASQLSNVIEGKLRELEIESSGEGKIENGKVAEEDSNPCPENSHIDAVTGGCACDDLYEPNDTGTGCVRIEGMKERGKVLFTLPLDLDGKQVRLEYREGDVPEEAAYTFLKANGINDASVLENSTVQLKNIIQDQLKSLQGETTIKKMEETMETAEKVEANPCPANAHPDPSAPGRCICAANFEPSKDGTSCVSVKEKKVIFSLPLDVNGQQKLLEFREGQTPKGAAYDFCIENGITDQASLDMYIPQLSQVLEEKLQNQGSKRATTATQTNENVAADEKETSTVSSSDTNQFGLNPEKENTDWFVIFFLSWLVLGSCGYYLHQSNEDAEVVDQKKKKKKIR
eukprot:g2856.t1